MTQKQRVALISTPGDERAALAVYLRGSGFEVHECDELTVTSSFAALVVIAAHPTADALVADVRARIKLTKQQRVVVVTSRPTVLKTLVARYGERLHVLPAPAFGWDLVDALRSGPASRPRGA